MNSSEAGRLRKAAELHVRNPVVWELFVKFTLELIARNFKHHSVRSVWHRIRWETPAGDDGVIRFKLGDHHAKFYGRRFMKEYPEHEGFFRSRNTDKILREMAEHD